MAGNFDESLHPRAPDGKFGTGGGSGSGKQAAVAKGKRKVAERAIKNAYDHVANGDHAKARALFEKHGHMPDENTRVKMAKSGELMVDKKPGVIKDAFGPRLSPEEKEKQYEKQIKDAEFSPHDQKRLRDDSTRLLADHGLKVRDEYNIQANNETVRVFGNLERSSYAFVESEGENRGRVNLSVTAAADLRLYMRMEATHGKEGIAKLFNEHAERGTGNQEQRDAATAVIGMHAITHEQIHTTGPRDHYNGRGVYGEEIATEMAARQLTAKSLGVVTDQFPTYRNIIDPTIRHLQQASGMDRPSVHEELGKAALLFKQGKLTEGEENGVIHGDQVIRNISSHALKNLGVTDTKVHDEVYEKLLQIADNM